MTRPTSTAPGRGYELDDALRRLKERLIRLELTVARRRYAAGTGIADADGNFVSGDVEGALAELADVLSNATGPPIDRALDGTATSIGESPDFAIVQQTNQRNTLASSLTLTLPAPPTPGNLLVIWHVTRSAPTPTGPSSGWTAHPDGVASAAGAGEHGAMFYRVVEEGDGASVVSNNSAGAQSAAILVEISGAGFVEDNNEVNDAFDSAMSAGVTTAGAGLVIGGAVVAVSDTGTDTVAPDAGTSEIDELYSNPSNPRKPTAWLGYKTVLAGGTHAIEATISAARNWGMQVLAFVLGDPLWDVPEPNVNDGDDATFEEIEGANVVRIDLGADYRITSTRLLIGSEFAGAKTYVIRGSVDVGFDPDLTETLVTLNFTATGGFTADEVEASWAPGVMYRYFELTGDDETRRVFSWELFQQPFALNLDHGALTGLGDDDHPQYADDADLTAHVTDATDAHDASAISAADAGGWFVGTDVEAQLQELAAKVVGYEPHGDLGAAVTFDAAKGWHSGTFTDDCTFTLTPAPTGTVSSLFLELATGAGGFTLTLPAAVVNRVALEAAFAAMPGGETAFLVLLSRNGGTAWFGGWWGGPGGTPASTVTDETTFGIAPDAGTDTEYARQDHTHGTPPLGTTAGTAAEGDHTHAPNGIGPLLLASDHATPIVFDDILQASDGADFLYASEP